MSEKIVVKILMAFGHFGAGISVLVFLFALFSIFFGGDTNYARAWTAVGASILSFVSFTAFIGFAYVVKHVCNIED